MALVRCRECGSQVSRRVRTCPHCGIGNPDPGHYDPNRRLRKIRFWFIVLSIPILFLHLWGGKVGWDRTRSTPSTTERNQKKRNEQEKTADGGGNVLEDRMYKNYAECDAVATVVAQKLKDKGVEIDLERDPVTELTIYTGQYRDAAIRFSCIGGRYKSEIIEE